MEVPSSASKNAGLPQKYRFDFQSNIGLHVAPIHVQHNFTCWAAENNNHKVVLLIPRSAENSISFSVSSKLRLTCISACL